MTAPPDIGRRDWFMVRAYADGANLVTALNILIGMTALFCALNGAIGLCINLLFAAVLLDHLDGWLARRFYAHRRDSREFGKQFDTLADLLNFNIAPGVLLVVLYAPVPAFPVASLLVLCGCIRLAHFNISSSGGGRDYLGIPTTYVGFALLNIIMLARAGMLDARAVLALAAVLSLMQIARVPLRLPGTAACVTAVSVVFGATLAVCGYRP